MFFFGRSRAPEYGVSKLWPRARCRSQRAVSHICRYIPRNLTHGATHRATITLIGKPSNREAFPLRSGVGPQRAHRSPRSEMERSAWVLWVEPSTSQRCNLVVANVARINL